MLEKFRMPTHLPCAKSEDLLGLIGFDPSQLRAALLGHLSERATQEGRLKPGETCITCQLASAGRQVRSRTDADLRTAATGRPFTTDRLLADDPQPWGYPRPRTAGRPLDRGLTDVRNDLRANGSIRSTVKMLFKILGNRGIPDVP